MKFISVSDYAKAENITSRAVYKRISAQKIYATEIDGKKYIIENCEPKETIKEVQKVVHIEDTTKIDELKDQIQKTKDTLKSTETTLRALKDENTSLYTKLEKKPQIEYVDKEIEVHKTSWWTWFLLLLLILSFFLCYLLLNNVSESNWYEDNNITELHGINHNNYKYIILKEKEILKVKRNHEDKYLMIWFKNEEN